MKTVGEFKKAGVVFVRGDKCKDDAFSYTNRWVLDKSEDFDVCELTEFAWRDLTTKPDNPQYKIELDIANHRWRPSLNQGVAPVNPTEFKAGDLVEVEHCATGKYLVKIKYIDTVSLFGYLHSDDNQPFCAYMNEITIKPHNPKLNELKDIIGLHDDPTECAKAILAAGYTK